MNEQATSYIQSIAQQEEAFLLLSELQKAPDMTQRQLAIKLNISLGKTNYLIKEMIKKGFLKMISFSRKPQKVKKAGYMITPEGFSAVMKLAYAYLKIKEAEYKRMKKEWKDLQNKSTVSRKEGDHVR